MRLYIIRHGQSVNNFLWTTNNSEKGRSYDPELTDIGKQQAQHVAAFMRDELAVRPPLMGRYNDEARPKIIYTSLMTRAVETGRAVASALGVPLVAHGEVYECGGLYLEDEETGERNGQPGPNRAHFETKYPDLQLPDALGEEGWYNRPFEDNSVRAERAQRVWTELVTRHGETEDVIGLISHGGFYNELLAILLKAPRRNQWFTYNNCALTRIDIVKEGLAFVYLNRFDYLPPELVTL